MRRIYVIAILVPIVVALVLVASAYSATTFYVGQVNGIPSTINQTWKSTPSHAARSGNWVQPTSGCLNNSSRYELRYVRPNGSVQSTQVSAFGKCAGFAAGGSGGEQVKAQCRIYGSVSREGFCWTNW